MSYDVQLLWALGRAVSTMTALLTLGTTAAATPTEEPLPAFTEPEDVPRLALVIGVQNYDYLDEVPNALHDAAEAASALKSAGFSILGLLENPTGQLISDAVKALAQRTTMADQPVILAIFFAGHGFQSEGHTYVAPVEATRNDPADLSLSIADLMAQVAVPGRGGLAMIFVDACRTSVRPSGGPPAISADDGIPRPPVGAVFSLATKAGAPARSAAHVGSTSSPYTSALRLYIPSELRLTAMFEEVSILVQSLTQYDQSPDIVYGTTGADGFYFMPKEPQRKAEYLAWRKALESNRPECIHRFIMKHPDSQFLRSAMRWLSQTEGASVMPGGMLCADE